MSENLPNVTPETASSEEDTADSKSKKKKKAIGAFIVEAEPQGLFDRLTGKDKKAEQAKKESDSDEESKVEKPVAATETDAEAKESIEPEEQQEVVSQLAAARMQELATAEETEAVDPAEKAAVATYLAAAQAEGDIEAAYIETVDRIEATDPVEDEPIAEQVISTDQSSEGEIDLESAASQPETGGGNARPPLPPAGLPPLPPAGGQPPFGGIGGPNFNQPPTAPEHESSVPLDVAANRVRQAQSEGLIVGGIVGYLVGRRRGRIRTEKKLLPVQKKLEKQVKVLQNELLTKETLVRQHVRENAPVATARQKVEKFPATVVKETRTERLKAVPAVAPERIGHVVIAANLGRESSPAKKPSIAETLSARKRAETMSRQELLAASEKVSVEGTTLRKIYETQLISEKGLRRLVAEHLRGGNVSRALKRELVEREIDFERDPILRDKDHGSGSDAAGKAALAAMLARVGVSEDTEQEQIGNNAVKKQKESSAKKAKQPNVMTTADVSLISLISVLALAIVVILFRG